MKFKEFYINESINDKNLMKVIFLAGGPGSGKTFISNMAFTGEPVVYINSDKITEFLFNKKDLPLVFDKNQKDIYKRQMDVRNFAKALTDKKLQNAINGLLPIVIDGTGRDYDGIKTNYDMFKSIGYDPYMLFVNSSLDVSKQRNAKRARTIPEDLVIKYWEASQNNIGKFQELFGRSNFKIIDNNKILTDEEEEKLKLELTRLVRTFLNEPLKNIIGRNIILSLKDIGGTYLSDLDKVETKNEI